MISKAWIGRTYVSPFYSVGLPRKAVASYWHMLLHSNIFNLHSTYDKFALTILKLFFRVFWWFSCTVFLGGSNIQFCLRKKVYLISPYASVQLLVASCQILDLLLLSETPLLQHEKVKQIFFENFFHTSGNMKAFWRFPWEFSRLILIQIVCYIGNCKKACKLSSFKRFTPPCKG